MKVKYIKPELEVLIPAESLLDTQPKDSSVHEDDPILSKPDFDYEEDKTDTSSLWED